MLETPKLVSHTIILNLEDRKLRDIWNNLDKKARWAIRNAERKGIDIIDVDEKNPHFEDFYNLYIETYKRKGVEFIVKNKKVLKYYLSQKKAKLFCAVMDNKVISGLFLTHSNDKATELAIGTDYRYVKMTPNDLVKWYAIKWYYKNGFKIYDFGGISHESTGIRNFKDKWGGAYKDCYRNVSIPRFIAITILSRFLTLRKLYLRIKRKVEWLIIKGGGQI